MLTVHKNSGAGGVSVGALVPARVDARVKQGLPGGGLCATGQGWTYVQDLPGPGIGRAPGPPLEAPVAGQHRVRAGRRPVRVHRSTR